MPSVINAALILIALSLLALIFLLIGLLLEVRRLASELRLFLQKAQTDWSPILSNLTTTSARIRDASSQVGEGIAKVSDLLAAIGEGAGTIRLLNSILRSFMPSSVIGAASFVVGLKAGLAVLMNHWLRRRKEK
ncbi:MAG: hypothetical protein QHH30_01350 [candidate division NC10 bacterium]|nr:hypothetical protein [candidate division NC10 bacterium]